MKPILQAHVHASIERRNISGATNGKGEGREILKGVTCRRISCAASDAAPRSVTDVVAYRMTTIDMIFLEDSDTPACTHDVLTRSY